MCHTSKQKAAGTSDTITVDGLAYGAFYLDYLMSSFLGHRRSLLGRPSIRGINCSDGRGLFDGSDRSRQSAATSSADCSLGIFGLPNHHLTSTDGGFMSVLQVHVCSLADTYSWF